MVIAKEVTEESDVLLAGDICNTNTCDPENPDTQCQVQNMFEEQVAWAVDAGVDYVIGETFSYVEEALVALDVILQSGLPAVITLAFHRATETREGLTPEDACKRLVDAGAAVVGLNGSRGPRTMLPLLERICPAVDVPVAALPVPYRTHHKEPTFQSLRDPECESLPMDMPFLTALDPFTCNRYEIADFTRTARDLGVSYFSVCCGAAPHHIRSMAEALGRKPPASRYSPDLSKHGHFGSDATLRQHNVAFKDEL